MDIWEKGVIAFFIALMIPFTAALSFSLYKNQTLNENLATASLYGVFHKKNIDNNIISNSQSINLNSLNNLNTVKAEKLAKAPEIINAIYVQDYI